MGKPATYDAQHFRFYEDGTESGSSPSANEDTNVTGRSVDSDSQIQLRYMVEETNSGSGASTDDWALEYDKNSSGTWVPVTGSSAAVRADSGSSLSDGSLTTNRGTNGLTDGSGSFVAGEQEAANGVIEDREITTNNFSESVWGLLLVSSDLANGDTLDFRMTYNGGTPGMTNNVTPRITVQKIVSVKNYYSGGLSAAQRLTRGIGWKG